MKKATRLGITTILVGMFLVATSSAQITIDGTSNEAEYTTLATYTSGNDGFGSTNNIDEINFYADGNDIYIGVPSDLDGNNNIIVWMNFSGYDGQDAGNVVGESGQTGVFGGSGLDGAILDFEVDFGFAFNEGSGTSNLFLDAARYGNTGIIFASGFVGQSDQSGNSVSIPSTDISNLFNANSIDMAYNNGGGSDQGIEFKIDIGNIPGVDSTNTVQIFVAITNSTGFMSNEFIPSGSYTGSNLGDDGNVGGLTGDYFTTAELLQHNVEISGDAGWRLLSLPKTGGTVADVSDDSPVQGITGGDNTSNDANFFIYNNSGSFTEPTNTSTAWGNGLGFAMYFFNNTTAGSSTLPVTLDASGAPPTSDVVVDLYSGATGRYTLVGNPFAARVNLANVSANIAISSNMSFWDDAAGSYTTASTSSDLIIEPWQGYWVQTSSSTAGGQLTFGTSDKTSSSATQTHFDKTNPNALKELAFTLTSSYNTEKNLKLQIADDASLDFDTYDLVKLGSLLSQNVSAAFVGKMDGADVLKGIEAIPSSLDKEITLPIVVDLTGESQTLTFAWEGLSSIPSDWGVRLHDYETGQNFDLRTLGKYEFDVAVKDVNGKVNPLSVLKNSLGEPMKSKSNNSPRLGITITPNTTSVNNEEEGKVEGFALSQNYPNPFNPTTTINYSVENTGPVMISIYNLMGQKVAELVNESKAAGSYNVTWNAANAASGMYYYRLESAGQTLTRKMTLIK